MRNLKEITLEDLKEIQLDILCYVDKFCKENEIKYWIDCGTLLGAVRHGGYIPWDDDIDIGMLREDYEWFRMTFPKTMGRYQLRCAEFDLEHGYPFGKVIDTHTELYEPDENGMKSSVYIDVFVYDNAPDDEKALKKMFRKRDFWNKLMIYRNGMQMENPDGKKKLRKKAAVKLLSILPPNFIPKRIIRNSKKYAGKNTERVGNFTAFDLMTCRRAAVENTVDKVFEGKVFCAPEGTDEWLRAFYGDYMKLPPEDKRVSKHRFKAYRI